jgi:uncharacterized protein (DUF2141 family)
MKTRPALTVLAALLAAGAAHAQNCLRVEVHHVRPQQGMLMVAAYAEAENYNKKPLALMQLRPDKDKLQFEVCGATGPALALSLFQDLNGNGKLDTNVIGIPSEPWGASGKPSNFEAPRWDTTQVPIDGQPVVVKLSQ